MIVKDDDRIKILQLMDAANAKRSEAQKKPKEKTKRALPPLLLS